jgi:hypothetical protein
MPNIHNIHRSRVNLQLCLSSVGEQCFMFYLLSNNDLTDQGDETEGLDMEELEGEALDTDWRGRV